MGRLSVNLSSFCTSCTLIQKEIDGKAGVQQKECNGVHEECTRARECHRNDFLKKAWKSYSTVLANST